MSTETQHDVEQPQSTKPTARTVRVRYAVLSGTGFVINEALIKVTDRYNKGDFVDASPNTNEYIGTTLIPTLLGENVCSVRCELGQFSYPRAVPEGAENSFAAFLMGMYLRDLGKTIVRGTAYLFGFDNGELVSLPRAVISKLTAHRETFVEDQAQAEAGGASRRRRKKKAPNGPTPIRSAFYFFRQKFHSDQAEAKAKAKAEAGDSDEPKDPEVKAQPGVLSKLCADLWGKLEEHEKAPYAALSAADAERFEQEKVKWQAEHPIRPRRPRTAYQMYGRKPVPWKDLGEEEKKAYEKLAEDDKIRFEDEMTVYHELCEKYPDEAPPPSQELLVPKSMLPEQPKSTKTTKAKRVVAPEQPKPKKRVRSAAAKKPVASEETEVEEGEVVEPKKPKRARKAAPVDDEPDEKPPAKKKSATTRVRKSAKKAAPVEADAEGDVPMLEHDADGNDESWLKPMVYDDAGALISVA